MSWNSQAEPGLFVQSTQNWDIARLFEIDVTSPEFKNLIVQLYQQINNIALVLNLKDSGYYVEQEFVNGQVFSPSPTNPYGVQVFRKVISFGALPNAGTKTVAHGLTITSGFNFTRIYGCATDPSTSFIPLPYSSPTLNQNISLSVDTTNVTITTAIDYSGYTTTWVILEYLKSS